MRNVLKVTMVVGAIALLAGPALAQRPPGGGGFGGGLGVSGLLRNADVQKELAIDEAQMKKVTEALTKVADDNKELTAKLADRQTPREERTEITKKLNDASMAGLKDTLKEEQTKRLKQIMFQQTARTRGVAIYTDADVAKTLKLTDAQTKDIKTLADEVAKERPMFGGGGQPNPDAFTKYQALVKEATEKVTKMLTDEQKKAYEEMTGKAFELRLGGPGGGRPPGGGGRPPQ